MARFSPLPVRPARARVPALASLAVTVLVLVTGCSYRMEEPAPVAAEAMAVPEAADSGAMPVPPPRGRYRGEPRRGVVTAGDIDDMLNLAAFQRYLDRARAALNLPAADFSRPVLLQLVGPDGAPAPGVFFSLARPGAADPFHSGYSGVDGRIAVFPALHGARGLGSVELRAYPEAQGGPFVTRVSASDRPARVELPFAGGWRPDFVDIAFVVDATGSMGDEIAWLRREMAGIVREVRRAAPGADLRFALIAYRDHGDQFVLRNHGFTARPSEMQGWLRGLEAGGGGDYPEAAAAALRAGADLGWRRGRGERLMFHIADAPPHDKDARAYLQAAALAARKGVQIFGLGASGVGAGSEYLMRQAALGSQGRYLFLTDDSGVGYGHAEPTIPCYRVTELTDLMARLLRSELTGHRIEADEDGPFRIILREVGSYQAGLCRN